MRKDGVLPRGDWWNIVEAKKSSEPTKVYIYDEIGFWGTSAKDFVKELDALDVNKFELHLNSPGGEIFDGFTIYNSIKQHKATVTVFVDGLAASAASFIAMAGDEIIMAKAAEMMIHDGIGFAFGNEADMLETARILGGLSDTIAGIYADRAGKDQQYWRDLMKETLWMNGQEAVDFGLADKLLDSDTEDTEEADKAKNKWDLTLITNSAVTREQAEDPTRVAARVVMLSNQKEKPMADKATPKGPAPLPTPGNSSTDPAPDTGGTPTGDPQEPGVEVVPDQPAPTPDPDVPTPATPPTPAPSGPPPSTEGGTDPQASAAQQGVMINGKLVTDFATIQAHYTALETAQNEQRAVTRKNFVEGLAHANKIPAPMIDSLTALVNGDGAQVPPMSDAQYAAFVASYESAPASPLFGSHATTQQVDPEAQPGSKAQMSADAKRDRIAVLRGIVGQHERIMSREDVQKTPSYNELQKLLAEDDDKN
jgi:ATP-dependent protease ClpP protease subunit